MGKISFDRFITRNALIPLAEAEANPTEPSELSMQKLHAYIADNELEMDDFYINPRNQEKPYCYYRGTVFIEFGILDNDLFNLNQRILAIENRLNEAVAGRDFASFLKIIDPRLAPDLFMEIFNFIPDQDKYPLFEQLLNRNKYCRDVFNPEFMKQASLYKNASEKLPLADEQGYVKIFGSALQPSELDTQSIWFTNINNAIQAILSDYNADIFQAMVHVKDIKSYSAAKFDNKVTLDPLQVKQVQHLDLIKIEDLPAMMDAHGLTSWYFHYASQIQTDWFHNPQGIHALSHTKRVLLLGLILAHQEQLSDQDRGLICQAAIYHDIGRVTDGYDTEHGIASYRKLVGKGLLEQVPAEDHETIRFIIEEHAVVDKAALKQLSKYDLHDIEHTLKLYNIFKDADGLDRVRINDLNPDYLRSPSAHKLLLLAHQLYHTPQFEQLLEKQL